MLAPDSAPALENKPSTRAEAKHADTPNNLEQKSKELIGHRESFLRDINSSEADKNHTAVKNHSESSSKDSGGKGNKKRPPSNVSASRHGSLDVANLSETYPTERVETPAQAHYGRGGYRQLNVANQTERRRTPPQVHYGRGEYRQLNQTNLSTFPPHSLAEHNGTDGMFDSVSYQTQHVVTPRQGRSERGDYHQQQFNQSNITAYQPCSPTECAENDEVSSVVSKYINGPRGATSIQAYNPRHCPDQAFGAASNRRMGSPFESYPGEMHDGNESNHRNVHGIVQPIPDFGRQMGSPYGRVPPAQGTAYPPPYAGSRHPAEYGQRSMVGNSSYGGMNTPVTQRYASRLAEMRPGDTYARPDHGPMVGRGHRPVAPQPPYQGSLSFAPGPFHPQYSHDKSTGWLEE